MSALLRGRVYRARPDGFREDKFFLVVSNNLRNRNLPSVLAVRFTTSAKPALSSIIEVPGDEVLPSGRIVCDDIYELFDDEVKADLGAVTARLMDSVNEGLKSALGIVDR